MKTNKYVTIGERVDKAVNDQGPGGDAYRNHYLQQYWRAVMLEELECVDTSRRADGHGRPGPVPVPRIWIWLMMPKNNPRYPASVRATKPDTEPPWNIFADMSVTILEPSFLHNTFLELEVSEVNVELWENDNLVHPPSPIVVKSQRANHRGGAPERFPWDEFDFHLVEIANGIDGLPTGYGAQANLKDLMLQWCSDNWDRPPAESTVKDRIAKLYRQLDLADN